MGGDERRETRVGSGWQRVSDGDRSLSLKDFHLSVMGFGPQSLEPGCKIISAQSLDTDSPPRSLYWTSALLDSSAPAYGSSATGQGPQIGSA